jgi:hypothetical protein
VKLLKKLMVQVDVNKERRKDVKRRNKRKQKESRGRKWT